MEIDKKEMVNIKLDREDVMTAILTYISNREGIFCNDPKCVTLDINEDRLIGAWVNY